MITLGTAVLGLGGFLLVAAAVMFALRAGSRREQRAVAGTEPTALGSWRPGAGLVAGTGVIDYGPGGPLTGPVSGEDCAFYHVEVVRFPSRKSDDRTGHDQLGGINSTTAATLADRSGRVLVDPRMLRPVGDPIVTERSEARFATSVPDFIPPAMVGELRPYEEIALRELRLPAGRAVFAVGSVYGGPEDLHVLGPGPRGVTVFTTDSREQVLVRREKDVASTGGLLRAFGVLGLILTAGSAGMLFWLLS